MSYETTEYYRLLLRKQLKRRRLLPWRAYEERPTPGKDTVRRIMRHLAAKENGNG